MEFLREKGEWIVQCEVKTLALLNHSIREKIFLNRIHASTYLPVLYRRVNIAESYVS